MTANFDLRSVRCGSGSRTPDHDFASAAAMIPPSIGGPSEMLGKRAVEAAIGASAQVTACSTAVSETLRDAGGMAALLRY